MKEKIMKLLSTMKLVQYVTDKLRDYNEGRINCPA